MTIRDAVHATCWSLLRGRWVWARASGAGSKRLRCPGVQPMRAQACVVLAACEFLVFNRNTHGAIT